MISRTCFTSILFSVCLGASCVTGLCADTNNSAASATTANPGASQRALPQDLARVLSPNDVVSMTVYQEDDLNTKTIIDKNGMIMLPLLGQVKISSMTIGQATAQIQQLYNKDYLVNPQVNLIVEHFAERRFSVLGEVQRPGSFDFPQNEAVNLLQAIAMSGGYTRLGAPAKVSVRRLENGSPKVYHLNAAEMSEDPNRKPFEILPDDVVTVGERTF